MCVGMEVGSTFEMCVTTAELGGDLLTPLGVLGRFVAPCDLRSELGGWFRCALTMGVPWASLALACWLLLAEQRPVRWMRWTAPSGRFQVAHAWRLRPAVSACQGSLLDDGQAASWAERRGLWTAD